VFGLVAKASGIKVIHISYAAPHAPAICERFARSLRRKGLDHVLVISALTLIGILKEYVSYFNQARSHQAIGQRIPEQLVSPPGEPKAAKVIAFPVLNGLHHDCPWAAT
jgi:putative transposase